MIFVHLNVFFVTLWNSDGHGIFKAFFMVFTSFYEPYESNAHLFDYSVMEIPAPWCFPTQTNEKTHL